LVYHGLDLQRFAPDPGERAARDGTALDDPVVLMSVGRLVEKKGTDILLQALALLPPDLHWRLDHVGGGPLRKTLQAQARSLGLSERIQWRGALAQQQVIALYRNADLFALASRIAGDGDRDGLPNVLMEAQSQGVACVATDVSAIHELIVDGQSGLLVPPQDAQALARALESLIRDPQRRLALGTAGRMRVNAAFGLSSNIARLARKFGLRPTPDDQAA